jgi:hypothetical protein
MRVYDKISRATMNPGASSRRCVDSRLRFSTIQVVGHHAFQMLVLVGPSDVSIGSYFLHSLTLVGSRG